MCNNLKPEQELKICYSIDGQEFEFTSIDGMMYELSSKFELYEGKKYYESRCKRLIVENIITSCIDRFLKHCDKTVESNYDYNDFYEFSTVKQSEKDELIRIISQWADKHVVSDHFVPIGNIIEKTFTKQQIDEYYS